jgi:hypothetical protein
VSIPSPYSTPPIICFDPIKCHFLINWLYVCMSAGRASWGA